MSRKAKRELMYYVDELIKKRLGLYLMLVLFTLLFFYRFLIEAGVPSFIRYLFDILNIILFCVCIYNKPQIYIEDIILLSIYAFLVVYGTLSFFVNYSEWPSGATYYIYDLRSLLRFVMFFISCKNILTGQNINTLLNYMFIFHALNTLYIIYQFFTLEVEKYWMRGDNLNGFFGVETGGNLYLNILLVATTAVSLERINEKYWKTSVTVLILVANLVIATLVELRAFYLEFLFLVLLFFVLRNKQITPKLLLSFALSIISLLIVIALLIRLLYVIYPWMEGSMSIKRIVEIATNSYTGTGDISRLGFVRDIVSDVYHNKYIEAIYGVGLGTANTSGMSTAFCSEFYHLHYSWYSLSYIFVELGVFGLVLYPASFIALLISKAKYTNRKFLLFSWCLLALFIMIYDEALKTEIGYLYFFILAVPFVKDFSLTAYTCNEKRTLYEKK